MSDRAKAIEAVDTIISDLMQEADTCAVEGEALERLLATHQSAITLRGLIQDGWPPVAGAARWCERERIICSRCGGDTGWAWVGGVPPLDVLCSTCRKSGGSPEADEEHEQVRAELDAKYACPTCGTRPVGPGSTSCEVCGSALEQGWIHLAAVVAARLSDEPHLVECPNCHLKLADVGASHCDGCAEGT